MERRQFLQLLPFSVAAAAGCSAVPTREQPREFHLRAVEGHALRDPGKPGVLAWTYNGGVPGPQLRVRQRDRVRIHVENLLSVPTTVHWHGVRVPNAMDGVPHLTQRPIAPGERFTYEFDALDAGTYWYHSHFKSSEQMERGLYGMMIVDEPDDLPFSRDVTWLLDDWRITASGSVSETFGNAHDISHAGRIGNVVAVNGSMHEEFAIRTGERIRLRLANAANARIFALKFQNHRPLIIALDGHPVRPHEPVQDRVILAPGMRCDLLLEGSQQPGTRHDVQDLFYPRDAYVLMQLVYENEARAADLTAFTPAPANPLSEPDLTSAVVHEIRFEGGMMGSLHRALLDGQPTDMRALLRRGKAWAVNGVVSDGHAMQPSLHLNRGRSYLFRMNNATRWHHSIHLHGHTFRVLRRNGKATDHQEWQDTVLMAPDEHVDVAFVADNPGDWMFHCHIVEHMEGGMMSVIRVL